MAQCGGESSMSKVSGSSVEAEAFGIMGSVERQGP